VHAIPPPSQQQNVAGKRIVARTNGSEDLNSPVPTLFASFSSPRGTEQRRTAKPVNQIRVGRILLLLGKIRTQKCINLLLEISPFAIVYVDGSRQLNELLIE
jgi:hypothetical protein